MLITGAPCILHTNGSSSSIYIAFGAVVAVQVFLVLIWSVLARHVNLIQAQNRFCATYHANKSLNCACIANVCRMPEVCNKSRLGRNSCELVGSKPTNQPITTNKPMESWLTLRAGRYIDPGEHRHSSRVAGVVEVRRISQPGMEPYLPRVRRICPPIGWRASIILLLKVGDRCGAWTNQRFSPMELRFPHRVGRCRP